MKKNIFFVAGVLFIALILSGCGKEGSVISNNGLKEVKGSGYSIQVPASWESADLTKLSVPVRGNLELGMRSVVSKRGFMNNISILSEDLMTETSSGEYARQSMLWAGREYQSMIIESEEVVTFEDGSTSQIGIFRARYNDATDERLFMQSAKVCEKKVYLITLGLSSDTASNTYSQYRDIIASFVCVDLKEKK